MSETELAHFGVKGMHWGQRKAESSGGSGGGGSAGGVKTRKELKGLDKASRKADNEKRNSEIDTARQNIKSGANRTKYLDAKAKYKADRLVVGKREAKKAFNQVKNENIADAQKAQEYKSGKETVGAILGTVAVGVAYAALKGAAR